MKDFKSKFKNYGFWLSLSGAIVVFLQMCGLKIEQPVVEGIVNAFCGILVVLGIVNNPNEGKFY
ncbi:MAG: holin [Clostridia bacterium]